MLMMTVMIERLNSQAATTVGHHRSSEGFLACNNNLMGDLTIIVIIVVIMIIITIVQQKFERRHLVMKMRLLHQVGKEVVNISERLKKTFVEAATLTISSSLENSKSH